MLSSMLAIILLASSATRMLAHEIRPAIADVSVQGNQVSIDILLTLETLVAGLDVSELEDTNASPLAERYDALRALDPKALRAAFDKAWPDIRGGIHILAGDKRLTPDVTALEIPPTGDLELPRESRLSLVADLPPDATPVIFGWDGAYGPIVVRQILEDGDGYSGYLTKGDLSAPMPRSESARQPWLKAFTSYIVIGFEHIIPKGLDHILFVLGLFFFSLKMRPLLLQITAFTVAHTVSLALATLGIVQIPASIVEPLIAASIVYVAVENIMLNDLRPWRPAVVFGFGLLHGLGFAAVLGEIGLDPGRFATNLIGFNVGVELGQLTVIAAAWLAVGFWFGKKPWYQAVIARPASLAIAIVGGYWFIERVFL